ncbi:hypothetical protein GL279_07410 [Paracoccus limosus]|jgi:DNA-binding NarL/FixJ family response regulator|uniref:Uncharacterized protein n=1 Tax=Paracoccus limosus TaxID=913252 RepID=A0A844H4F3_9RHOB|nr:hypothetical protein [Paracoccus limosus]MTH34423.1 hypothetical protein [Paracoccus limosus]
MTYVEQVKAEVAARYGVPVLCEVRIIPRGASALAPGAQSSPALNAPAAIPKTGRRKRAGGITADEEQKIIAMRRQGVSYRKIAADLGRSLNGVYKVAYLWG